jgi:hypothetical protein
MLGVTQQTFNRWVTGQRSPRLSVVIDNALRELDKRLTTRANRAARRGRSMAEGGDGAEEAS